jgi:RNA polymerase sigma-70 factor, ECF subfamily
LPAPSDYGPNGTRLNAIEPFCRVCVRPGVERELTGLTPAEEEDLRLMERTRDGDMQAFALLVRRHRERVATFLYRLSWDREKAEDGAREFFLRLWLARGRYEPRGRFTTFLYQIAHNQWLDELRRRRARPVEVGTVEGDLPGCRPLRAPAASEPLHQLFVRYQQWRIRQAIRRLPERYRLVFVLAHLEERRLAEVADVLQIPVGTVKSRLNTAVRMLRRSLGTASGDDDHEM